jgi:hypothetical protein
MWCTTATVGGAAAQALDASRVSSWSTSTTTSPERPTQVAHRRRHEGRERARERREPQARRSVAQIADDGVRGAERRERPVDVGPQRRSRGRRTQRAAARGRRA